MFSYGKDGTWWRVLTIDKENYTALVIADSSIAKKEYNVTKGSITWENCSLRNWLNNIYFEESFSEEEKDSIIDTDVINSDNAKYNTKGGNNTKDKIWLLSIDETKMYFENNEECSMGCWWWLRSPGIYDCGAATVDNDGCVSEFGSSVYDGNGAVRPAFWINLKSSFFQAMTTDFEKLNIMVPNYTLFGKKICKVRPGIKKLIISEGVESIGEKALCHCKKLESITIPNGVAYIGNGAFCGCISLKSITIPEGITEIPEDCFKNANSLNTIALPNTIKKIKKEAFCGCTNLEIITGTNGSITYETGVFDGCSKLKYTPEMFHNTGKLCDSFANNLELCGPEEYAWIIMYQKGKIWNEVISKTINEKNATEVLRYIIEHILKIKKSPKKVASVATEFVIKNVRILSADRINELIKVLQNEMLTELSDKLLSDPMVKTIVNPKENNTCEMESEPQIQRADGSIWYGSNPVPLAVGAIITFGLNTTNWRVLSIDIANDTAIVISDDYICRKEYNNRFENVNWERSSLRKWLNGEFLNTYFMPDEKEAILEAYISKQGNIEYLKRDDNDINDKIWLLNIEEVRKYFENNKDRAIGYRWWLRSLGHNNISAACVDSAGSVSEYGYYVNECAVVRPAFIIDFKASILKSRISINSDGETIINNPEFVVKNGKVIGIGGNLTEIEFPSFVTEIPGELLCKAKKLKSVVIPESIKKVESYAFAGCTSLEKIEIRNSNLIFDKNVFGEDNDRSEATNIIPEGLRSDIYDIGIHMAIEDIRDIILNDEIWSKLNPKQQAKLFIQRQSENLKKTYKALLTEKNSYQMAEAIAEEINKDFSKKECNTVAFFMTEFSDLISVNVAKTIYSKLKECKRSDMAIKTIESCEVIMFRINASDSGKIIMTKEEQILQNTLEALGYTRRSVEINLKEYFNIEKNDLPVIMYQDGNIANPLALALILVAHNDYHKQGIMPEIQNLVDYLDRISFMSAIKSLGDRYLYKYQNGKQKFLAFPICRYADEEIMKELTKQAPGWKTGVSGIYAPPLVNFREAIIYSDTKSAMMFADKMHDLGKYAALRGLSENDFRDTYLSDIGLDKNGRKEYDLGTQKVTAVLQKDMSFLIETEDGKMMKSVPKKDSDLELFEIANKDFKNICSQAKKIIKNRADKLFEDFLSGNEKNAESWMKAYLENKLLQSVAEHIVWSQGDNSFIVSGKDIVDVNGNPCEIKQDVGIKVAHPMEMETNTVDLWRDYLKKNRISQPFEQIWELAYKEEEISEDRYRGCGIYWRRVQNADKHGIHFFDEEYHNIVGFNLDDCQMDYELDNQMRHMVSNDSNFILGEFKVNRFTRKANHIIWLFDKWTIWNRIKNDDMKVMELIERFNEVQINEFINIAIEKQATKLTAALMSYKEENFKSNDAFEDYVLEW